MANRGSVSVPKAKQKRALRLLKNRVSAGNTLSLRSSCHRKRWGEPRVCFRTESQTKKSPKALFCLVLPLGIEPGTAP